MNCFCKTCKDSQEIVIAVPVKIPVQLAVPGNCPYWMPTPNEELERKFCIPCPDCAVPIDISLIQAQPAAAE